MQNEPKKPAATKARKPRAVRTPKPETAKPVTAAPAKAKAAKPSDADKAKARAEFAERVAADRKLAAETFGTFDAATVSVAVKSFAAFKRSYRRDVAAHAIGRKPSARQAATLTYACLASGKAVSDGATFPRRFTHNGRELAIENGALSDCIASGLATYNGAADTVTLTSAKAVRELCGTYAKLA